MLYARLRMLLDSLEAVLWEIQPGMAMEREANQTSKLPCLHRSHHFLTNALKADSVCRAASLCVAVQIFEVLRHGEVEQRQAVIEDGSCADDLAAVLIGGL